MFKTLTATALAATIALTGTTTSAAADNNEVARFIFGAAALALIAKSLENQNNQTVSRTHTYHAAPVIVPRGYNGGQGGGYNGHGKDRGHGHVQARSVPKSCEQVLNTRDGIRRVYGVPCLNRSGYTARLPQDCLRIVKLNRGDVQAYGKQCLLNRGIRVDS